MDVRVDGGPQDGTILVTWIPVTLNTTSVKHVPVTGYAVFADGKRVTDVDSPRLQNSDNCQGAWTNFSFGFTALIMPWWIWAALATSIPSSSQSDPKVATFCPTTPVLFPFKPVREPNARRG